MILTLFVVGTLMPIDASVATAKSEAVMLLDGESGLVIYSKNADEIMEMASTTKIFTLYFAIEKVEDINFDIKEKHTVKKEWTGIEGSSIYLVEGEKVSLEELFYGLMLRSGNDSAVAIVEILFGSEENFVSYVETRLQELGFEKTCIKNPHGLSAVGHHTTARELAEFASMAMKNPLFKEIVSTKFFKGDRGSYSNKNKILRNVEGGNGIKTGYTKKAGRCLVSGAERNGKQIIMAVLNCADMFERSKFHLDSFFERYEYIDVSDELLKNQVPTEIFGNYVKIGLKNNVTEIPVLKGENIDIKITTVKNLDYMSKIGTFVGNLELYSGNDLIFSEKLYTIESSDKNIIK